MERRKFVISAALPQADICGAPTHVRFTPNCDGESGFPQEVMSALTPKADMCSAARDVRYGPKADIESNLSPNTLFARTACSAHD